MVRGRIGGYAAVEQLIKEVKHLFGLASDDLTDVIVQICETPVLTAIRSTC